MIFSSDEKVYPFNQDGLTRAIIDNKTDKFGSVTQVIIYLVIIGLFVNKKIDTGFITTYIAGSVGSRIAKYLVR